MLPPGFSATYSARSTVLLQGYLAVTATVTVPAITTMRPAPSVPRCHQKTSDRRVRSQYSLTCIPRVTQDDAPQTPRGAWAWAWRLEFSSSGSTYHIHCTRHLCRRPSSSGWTHRAKRRPRTATLARSDAAGTCRLDPAIVRASPSLLVMGNGPHSGRGLMHALPPAPFLPVAHR